jgi:hypothetical protein
LPFEKDCNRISLWPFHQRTFAACLLPDRSRAGVHLTDKRTVDQFLRKSGQDSVDVAFGYRQ